MPGHLILASQPAGPWRNHLWALMRSRWSLGFGAAVIVAGMVLVFYTVVTQAVHQSALRQQALAAQSQAVWRCKMLPSAAARQGCLQDIPALLANGI